MVGCSPQIPEALGSISNITKAGKNTLKTIKHSASVMPPLNMCKVTGWMVQERNKMALMVVLKTALCQQTGHQRLSSAHNSSA